MLLVDDLAAGGTKNLRHAPRGLVTLDERRHFSFFHEHLSRCKYCSEAYSTPEEVVQHCATSH